MTKILTSIGVLVLFVPPGAALAQEGYCRFYVVLQNRNRDVVTAPFNGECSGDPIDCFPAAEHTVPWGNWGVNSNVGARVDQDQFAGWCTSGDSEGCDSSSGGGVGDWEWNSCRAEFPPRDCNFYNAADCWEQTSTAPNVQWYGTLVFDAYVPSGGCSVYDGVGFVLENNYMDLWELDPCDEDENVYELLYPDLTVTRTCSSSSCGPDVSSWVNPNGGDTLHVAAQIRMIVEGEFFEEPLVVDQGTEQSTRLLTASDFARLIPHVGTSIPLNRFARRTLAADNMAGAQWRVSGNVVGPSGPIAGARVLLVDRRGEFMVSKTARTDSTGYFALTDVSSGVHEVVIAADGYAAERRQVTLPGEAQGKLQVTLRRGASIGGRVVDILGNPIADARIEIEYPPPIPTDARIRILNDWHRGRRITRSQGHFHLHDLLPGTPFTLRIQHADRGEFVAGTYQLEPGEERLDILVVWP